eukprot:m.118115 g.118115  ORF g.118115 m.118115 type:complete len:337 (-) comp16419_c1_seq4:337-1347(-)
MQPALGHSRHEESRERVVGGAMRRPAYWSGALSSLGSLAHDVDFESVCPLNEPGLAKHTMAWISSPQVHATWHYDLYHNAFVQLVGSKRLRIRPPREAATAIHLFPSLHPAYRQSQIPFSAFAASQASLDPATVSEVVVNPGDVVYLPPLWLHDIAGVDTGDNTSTVSANCWMDDQLITQAEALFRLELPFERNFPQGDVGSAIVVFLCALIGLVLDEPKMSLADVGAVLLTQRYDGLLATKAGAALEHNMPPNHLLPHGHYCGASAARQQAMAHAFAQTVNKAASFLLPLTQPARLLFILDFIEEVVHGFVGTAHVVMFARECLTSGEVCPVDSA